MKRRRHESKNLFDTIKGVASHDVVLPVTRLTFASLSSSLLIGCATAEASREPERRHLGSTTPALGTLVNAPQGAQADNFLSAERDSLLRRSYGSKDMKVHPCATVQDDGSIVGKDCPSALVVFGPYVTVPSKSDVQFRFNIEAGSPLSLRSDILSDGAKRFHGALEDEVLKPGEVRTVNYRIHVFDPVRAVETRIGVQNTTPVSFRITNLQVSIK